MDAKEWILQNVGEPFGKNEEKELKFWSKKMEEYAKQYFEENEWADPAEWVPDTKGPFLVWCESIFGPEYSGIHYFDVKESGFYIKQEWDDFGQKEYLKGVLAWKPINRPKFLSELATDK